MTANQNDVVQVPRERRLLLADRLDKLVRAITQGDIRSEFSMRVPAERDRDADLVLSEVAAILRTPPAPTEAPEASASAAILAAMPSETTVALDAAIHAAVFGQFSRDGVRYSVVTGPATICGAVLHAVAPFVTPAPSAPSQGQEYIDSEGVDVRFKYASHLRHIADERTKISPRTLHDVADFIESMACVPPTTTDGGEAVRRDLSDLDTLINNAMRAVVKGEAKPTTQGAVLHELRQAIGIVSVLRAAAPKLSQAPR